MEVRPLQACSIASVVPRVRDGTFPLPTPSALTEPTWAQVPGWGFGNRGWARGGRNEWEVLRGGKHQAVGEADPQGTEEPAASRAEGLDCG